MRHFVEELEQLKTKLLEMGSLVESSIQRSILAVTQKDRDAAAEVFRNEARINAIEVEIDDFAVRLLALQQPMAADLAADRGGSEDQYGPGADGRSCRKASRASALR